MKQFVKITLATMVGIFLFSIASIFISLGIAGAIASSGQKAVKLKPNSVYELVLEGQLYDRSTDDPFSALLFESLGGASFSTVGLDDILSNIEKAKNDPNIEGIYLRGGLLIGGMANIKEIRDALLDFKSSGKFIVAYADTYLQSNYYLASVADRLLLNPHGMLEWKGLASETMFFKNTLEKLGVEVQVVRVGTFKSAVEPFTETRMSDANREQVITYVRSLWNTMVAEVSESRMLSTEQLNAIADEMTMFKQAPVLQEYALIDSLVYIDEVDSILKSYVSDYNLVSHKSMTKVADGKKFSRDKVAVIYALGAIDDGSSEGIISEKLVKTIDKAAKDKSVKSVVLRVSSPGGSAYGSEQIWRALTNLKKEKPLVVSMGDYAASGGYYIACMGDMIVAQPNTITGSIGIFGLIPNIEGLNKKLGLNFDGVKTNAQSDAISLNRPFRPEERAMMQAYVNHGYELFVQRCADGREMSTNEIKAIAEGRVWTGADALNLGLVDVLGGLNDAISLAAELAELSEYQVREYPAKEDFTTRLMKSLSDDVETRWLKSKLGEYYPVIRQIKTIESMPVIQARMPYDIVFK